MVGRKGRVIGAFAALLIDCDGVLVDSADAIDAAWRRWAHDLGLDGDDVIKATRGRRSAEGIAEFVAEEALAAETARFEAIDLELSALVAPCRGATRFVRQIGEGRRWAVVTSANRSVALARLAAARLGRPPVLVAAEDVAHGKPAPDAYLLAAEQLGVRPDDCLAFDDLVVGVSAALAAGAYALLVGGSVAIPGMRSIRSLADVDVTAGEDLLTVRSGGRWRAWPQKK